MAVKGPETYLVQVPGNDRRSEHANHLIPDDARGMSAHKEIVTPEMVEGTCCSQNKVANSV